jgi:hypothetical protein
MKRLVSTRRRIAVIVAPMVVGMVSLAAVASADNVLNDVVVGGNDTFTAGGSTTVNYRIQATGGSCDAADGSAATVTINVPAGVTAAPGSRVFSSCGTAQSVTFSSNTPGNYGITVSVTDTAGSYNVNPASFTLHVLAPPGDSTPPVISHTLNPPTPNGNNGWYKSNVSLTWTVTENESPSSLVKTGCVDQNITTDQQATTYSCSATSNGGSAGPQSVTIKRDATQPDVSVTGFTDGQEFVKGVDALPTAGCSRSDATSGIDASGSTGPTASGGLNANGVGTVTYTCGAKDNAGNTNSDSKSYSVIYNYSGFFRPVDNLPDTWNRVRAGSGIPIKFSLDGDQGLGIIAAGFPKSKKIDCDTSADLDNVEQTRNSGKSALQYDLTTDQYTYVWKTDRDWKGTCRKLKLKLDDGTKHKAKFKFK